jgi:hypothetical protein
LGLIHVVKNCLPLIRKVILKNKYFSYLLVFFLWRIPAPFLGGPAATEGEEALKLITAAFFSEFDFCATYQPIR